MKKKDLILYIQAVCLALFIGQIALGWLTAAVAAYLAAWAATLHSIYVMFQADGVWERFQKTSLLRFFPERTRAPMMVWVSALLALFWPVMLIDIVAPERK